MVNYGVSRGCGTCKRRRMKCDEARPYCQRCIKANVSCVGYRDEADLVFRQYSGSAGASVLPSAGNNQPAVLQHHGRSRATLPDDVPIEQYAIACFMDDYCIVPTDRLSSRGYLDGLERLLARCGLTSDIGKATRAAALASLANKTHDNRLADRASAIYFELLSSFQVTMSDPGSANSVESLTAAVLMGLYEVISATLNRHGDHGAHLRGVAAILSNSSSPLSQHPANEALPEARVASASQTLGQPLQWPHHLGIMCPPSATSDATSLDSLLLRFATVFRHHAILAPNMSKSADDIRQLQEYALSIDEELRTWPKTQLPQWQATTIGHVLLRADWYGLPWHGRVDIYKDVYIGGVWNAYRKCRLVLLDLVHMCAKRLQALDDTSCSSYSERHVKREVRVLLEDFSASIPFLLLKDPATLLTDREKGRPSRDHSDHIKPTHSIGGILLIHPLHAVAGLTVISAQWSDMFRHILAWIGQEMCIGQATVLANPSSPLSKQYAVDGQVLVWLGTLVPGTTIGRGQETTSTAAQAYSRVSSCN